MPTSPPPRPAPTPTARHGAHPVDDANTRFTLWAPDAGTVQVALHGRRHDLAPGDSGWWSVVLPARHGDRYAYHLDDGEALPDPAARWLPDGVHEPAAVLDPRRLATAARPAFQAPPITGAVIYELHIGTFTDEGTFAAAIPHLPALVDLGVTHVEVMPVNAFDGRWGWGYDGVAWWAVHQPYGGPEAFAAFVAAAHEAGLAVILDVVHNHLGPSGSYLPRFGPYLQRDAESTWGRVINLDGPDAGPVREFIIGNALAWLRDHGVDGLRLDAVHALDDRGSATHLLAELSAAVEHLAEQTGRHLTLIAETDRNDPATLRPRALGGLGLDAQWADDLHHCIHVAVTGEDDGYYVDYADPLPLLAHALPHGLAYDGRRSAFRRRVVGAPVPPDVSLRRFVACVQNHDQVGNRPAGDRLTTLVDADRVRCAIALLCLAPHTPMLFQGEEYGETRPFAFFSDMPGEELRQAIRDGRKREFEYFASWKGEVPDPVDPATFEGSRLDRRAADTPAGQQRRALWTDLLALRRDLPALATGEAALVSASVEGRVLTLHRRPPAWAADAATVVAVANLGDDPVPAPPGTPVLTTQDPRYGGPGTDDAVTAPRSVAVHLLPAEPARSA